MGRLKGGRAWLLAMALAICVPLASFGWRWLARDEEDRSFACGSGPTAGTCSEGETTNMIVTLALLVTLVATLLPVLLTARGRNAPGRRRAALLADGQRATGRIVRAEPMPRGVWRYDVDFTTGTGTAVRFQQLGMPGLRTGAPAEVAYDPERPERAVLTDVALVTVG
jgi:hypothetical protein